MIQEYTNMDMFPRSHAERGNEENPTTAAKADMKTLAALHNPDMVAAGKDIITGFGDRGINSSIGRQWQDRVGILDDAACKEQAAGNGKKKLNVKLKRCKNSKKK